MKRPDACPYCKKPHDTIVPVAANRNWYGKKMKVMADGKEIELIHWFDSKGKPTPYLVGPRIFARPTQEELSKGLAAGKHRKDIHGKEIKLIVSTERVWLTELKIGNVSTWACMNCRASILSKMKKAKPQQKPDELFDPDSIEKKNTADSLEFFTD